MNRDTPKGGPKGSAQQAQGFLSASRSAAPSGPARVSLPEAPQPEPIEDEDFGDLSELLFAPTDRPDEPMDASVVPRGGLDSSAPPAALMQAINDKSLSEEFRGMLQLSFLADLMSRGIDIT